MLNSHQAYTQSMSIGNTYIHNEGESVVFGQHDFDNGGAGFTRCKLYKNLVIMSDLSIRIKDNIVLFRSILSYNIPTKIYKHLYIYNNSNTLY